MKKLYLKLSDLMKNVGEYYAHSKSDETGKNEYETLEAHTVLCQRYFERLCSTKEIKEKMDAFYDIFMPKKSKQGEMVFHRMWVNIVTFHDIGKINLRFQKEVLGRRDIGNTDVYFEVGSRHSVLSAVIYMEYYLGEIEELADEQEALRLLVLLLCNAYIISRHHSNLVSMEDFFTEEPRKEIRKAIFVLEQEYKKVFNREYKFDDACIQAMQEQFETQTRSKTQNIWLYFYEKLLYSLLVASDYYATTEYKSGLKITDFGELDNMSRLYETFENTTINQSIRKYQQHTYPMEREKLGKNRDINILRTELFLETEENFLHGERKSMYYIEAPTGGGKSNIALNLSFQMVREERAIKKIYYVYPYNTLIEQNQEILLRTFGEQNDIMKHIAVINSITPIKRVEEERKVESQSESGHYYEKALLNRQFLNYPIILTTHVSLFDTIFGDTKESAFGFHQLAGSVLVLDEIQSYRNEIWGEIITFLAELAQFLKMKIIIMSATLPNLCDLIDKKGFAAYLIKDRDRYFKHPCFKNRVIINRELLQKEISLDELLEHVKMHCGKGKKILFEFIRKGSAEEFYRRLLGEDWNETVYCMTGDDSILERKKILKNIKETGEQGCILVATQVIEAGVDIDMDVGYKAISMLDSEEQFLGRINRSFSETRTGFVYFFRMDDVKKIYGGNDIRANKDFQILEEENWNILKEKNFSEFYKEIFSIWKKNYGEGAGILRDSFENDFFNRSVKRMNFQEVKEHMKLIQEQKWSVSIFLGRVVLGELGEEIDGRKVWADYQCLLNDRKMGYAEKRVKLSEVRAKMDYFIYQVRKIDCAYTEQIGELFYLENGEEYIEDGKLNRAKIEGEIAEFI